MSKFFGNGLSLGVAVLINALLISSMTQAAEITENVVEGNQVNATETSENLTPLEQIVQYSDSLNSTAETPENSDSLEQVTSVSQLRDVQPTDWAFQALQSLVERYGCIEGYPDQTYRGNRAMTRYEFAAGLNK
ncbi:MAG TPA: iron uptake porin, partial [Phormidium sp.]